MNTKSTIDTLVNRESRTTKTSVYSDFQTLGYSLQERKHYAQQEPRYSEYQDFLYKRAMFGLKVYSSEELSTLHWQKKKRIIKVQKRTQTELNLFKQTKFIELTNKFLSVFSHSKMANDLLELYSEPDENFVCNMTFKELGITKTNVVNHFLKTGLLPNNFHFLPQINEAK
jgi:hypothetical protein